MRENAHFDAYVMCFAALIIRSREAKAQNEALASWALQTDVYEAVLRSFAESYAIIDEADMSAIKTLSSIAKRCFIFSKITYRTDVRCDKASLPRVREALRQLEYTYTLLDAMSLSNIHVQYCLSMACRPQLYADGLVLKLTIEVPRTKAPSRKQLVVLASGGSC